MIANWKLVPSVPTPAPATISPVAFSSTDISKTFRSFDETSLGALIALFELAVSLYAELIIVNAYNQPGVEAGKKAATNIINLQKEIEELLEDGKERTLRQINDALSTDSTESIYLILRKLSENSDHYSMNGNQSNPDQLIISKNWFLNNYIH